MIFKYIIVWKVKTFFGLCYCVFIQRLMPANLSKPSYYKTKLDHSIEIVNQESGNCQSLNMSSRLYKCEINRLDEKI